LAGAALVVVVTAAAKGPAREGAVTAEAVGMGGTVDRAMGAQTGAAMAVA